MASPLLALILDRIETRGPITVAEFVELALYHPVHGYYASADQRSGRAGDFYTSVDVGPVFGELLSVQIAEMWASVRRAEPAQGGQPTDAGFDLVEAAAGNARLSRDILDALARDHPHCLGALRLHLVERSPQARARQSAILGPHAVRLAGSGPELPPAVEGVILANELLDAMPPHLVVMREHGLREVHVDRVGRRLVTRELEPSTQRLRAYLDAVGASLEPGWFAEVNLVAADWVRLAARRLRRGFLVLIDYGHEARELYSATHAGGTLTSFRSHTAETRDQGPGWLAEPGTRDLTSHVDLTGVRLAAEAEGLATLAVLDQMYFLLGLGADRWAERSSGNPGHDLQRRLALKSLLMPGGIGSTHKVMIFSRGVGRPRLSGTAFGDRVT